MTRVSSFFCGLSVGGIAIFLLMYYIFLMPNYKYVELKSDYFMENGGVIKQGALLQVDKSFSEGFTRYILYLNLSDVEAVDLHQEQRSDIIIPYWLQIDTTKIE